MALKRFSFLLATFAIYVGAVFVHPASAQEKSKANSEDAVNKRELIRWPGYKTLYYRQGERSVYAENLNAQPGKVSLIDEFPGFNVEGGLAISPESLQEITNLYSKWLHSKDKAPPVAYRPAIEKALRAAGYINPLDPEAPVPVLTDRKPQHDSDEPDAAPNTRRNEFTTPAAVHIKVVGAAAAQLYTELRSLKPVLSIVKNRGGAPMKAWKKQIKEGTFTFTVFHYGETGESTDNSYINDEAVITTANNPYSFDGEYRQVIEVDGAAAIRVQQAMGIKQTDNDPAYWQYFYGEHDVAKLLLRLRTHGGKVLMHIELGVRGLPDGLHYFSEYYKIPRLALTHEYIDFTGRIVPSNFNPGPNGWAPGSSRDPVLRLYKIKD